MEGVIIKWDRLRRKFQWFDALYDPCASAHNCGVPLIDVPQTC